MAFWLWITYAGAKFSIDRSVPGASPGGDRTFSKPQPFELLRRFLRDSLILQLRVVLSKGADHPYRICIAAVRTAPPGVVRRNVRGQRSFAQAARFSRDGHREPPSDGRAKLTSMTTIARQLLQDALALSEDDRLALASEIIASVDGPRDADWEGAWLAELDRRTQAAATRGEPAAEWTEVRGRILKRLGRT